MTDPGPSQEALGDVDRLRRFLVRLRVYLPWLVVVAGALTTASFYLMARWGFMPLEAADGLAVVVALITLSAAWVLHVATRHISELTLRVLDETARNRQDMDARLRRGRDVAAISAHLQQAQRPAELAQALLSALAPQFKAYQSLCCLWDDREDLLVAAARYGGEGVDAEEVMTRRTRVGNLLGECAKSRQPLVIQQPGPDYLKVGSGLGEAAPESIVIFPVQHAGRLFAVLELATVEPFTDEGLQLLRELEPVFAMNLDILQKAERTQDLLAEARVAEENNRLILGAVGEGIWGMDEDGVTTFVNRAALDMLGFEEADAVGQPMHALVHHHHVDGTPYAEGDSPMSHTLFDGEQRRVTGEVLWRKDGTPLPVEYVTTGIHRAGQLAGAVVVFREVRS